MHPFTPFVYFFHPISKLTRPSFRCQQLGILPDFIDNSTHLTGVMKQVIIEKEEHLVQGHPPYKRLLVYQPVAVSLLVFTKDCDQLFA